MVDYVLEGPKWGAASLGTAGGIITWAIDATISGTFATEISNAFADWSVYANIQFQQVSSTASAMIDFTIGAIDGPDNILAETSYYYFGSTFASVSIEFDNGEGWHATSNGHAISHDDVSLFVVALHEIGHAIGLDHYNVAPAVMNAYINPTVTDLTQSDIHGAQALYGRTSESLFGSVTHDALSAGGEAYALYDAILGRTPDLLGFAEWAAELEHGTSLHDVAAGFLASPEGKLHLEATDNATFVEKLYQTALQRQADSAGLQGWVNILNQGGSRADVAIGFALSAENIAGMQTSLNAGIFVPDQDAANVARLYYGLLDRAPDTGGLARWTDSIKQGSSLTSIAQGFLNSTEYQNSHASMNDAQFIDSLYVGALGRHAESAGLQSWTSLLVGGTSHADIALGISESVEAHNYHLPHIEQGWLLV